MFESRSKGVTIPQGQLNPTIGSPNTLLDAVPMTMLGVRYCDEYGREHRSVMVVGGGYFYHAPNGEQWAGALKEAAPWLRDQLKKELESRSAEIPKEDAVDVVASMVHEEISANR